MRKEALRLGALFALTLLWAVVQPAGHALG